MADAGFKEDDTHVLRGTPADTSMLPKHTIGKEVLQELLQVSKGAVAMIDAITQDKLLHSDFVQKVLDLAAALQLLDYHGQNNVLAICSENCPDFFVPQYAALFNLSIAAPVNHNYTLYELEHVLKISRPKLVFCSKQTLDKFLHLKKTLTFIERIILLGERSKEDEIPQGVVFLDEFTEKTLEGKHVNPRAFQPAEGIAEKTIFLVMCSSGTTGQPKGVALSHLCLTTIFVQAALTQTPPTNGKPRMGLMPFFHAYGNVVTFGSLLKGLTTVFFKRFDEDAFLRNIEIYKFETLPLAPPIVVFLAKSPKVEQYDLSSVETVFSGAAPLSKTVEEELKKRLNSCEIRQAYGMTEMTLGVTGLPEGVQRPGSCGKLLPFLSGKVIDPDTGRSLGPRQVGELCWKGPSTMMGYYNDPQATKGIFSPGGWLRSGDIGFYDEEEYFYIVDRLKELIKYKGFQVAPAELEGVLLNHPDIEDAGVVGLPDEQAGERPLAFVVKRPRSQLTEDDVKTYVGGVLSPQKRLTGGVVFVEAIPKSPSGKILRKELRELLKLHLKSKL